MTAEEGLELLSKVYSLLCDQNVFSTNSDIKIIDFKDPDVLKKIINFNFDTDPMKIDEVENLCREIVKYSVKTNHVNYHLHLSQGYDVFGLCASWILEALNTFPSTYEQSPVFTLAEDAVLKFFLDKFGFIDGDGTFVSGGSLGNICGMSVARHVANPNSRKSGLFNQQELVAFTSTDSHYSIEKGIILLGIGQENLVKVPTNGKGKMCTISLENSIIECVTRGKRPFFVNVTSGTTVLGAFDEIEKIAEICQKYNVWMHIDASFGGHSIMSTKHRSLLRGSHLADSITYCPQKIGGVPLHCAMILLKQNGLLGACHSLKASYLFQSDKFYDTSYDNGDKGIQCSRKADGFKLWFMLKSRGESGIEQTTNKVFSCVRYFIQMIKQRPGFRLVLDMFECTNICFWFIPPSLRGQTESEHWWQQVYETTLKIQERMVKRGKLMVSYSQIKEKGWGNFFRLTVVSHPPSSEESMDAIIKEIEELGSDL